MASARMAATPKHKKGRENPLRIGRSCKHLKDLADAGLRTEQFRDRFESPGARKRDAEAAQDLRHGSRDQDVSQHLALPAPSVSAEFS